ncbi:MAG: SUMF1/EgtB/PvdO family nonheme iron enzyme, partial [Thermoguttaceae bacterium]
MSWPTSSDYREAVQHLDRRAADEELRSGRPSGGPGRPYVWGGGFADVYRVECPSDNTWALKCFTKKVAARHDRYRGIDAKLKEASLPFTVEFKYIERGILIPRLENQWFPVVKMQWVEGQTLDNGQIQRVEGQTLDRFVEDSLEKPRMLRQLLDLWPKLAARLRGAGIAHADLQHGNVLLVPAANGKLALRLVDYDGMWVPQLAGMPSGELGHPAYQHPRRLREGAYNRDVDRFSHLVIDCAVRCLLAGGPKLWQDFHGGDDKLLFAQGDFAEPRQSQLFRTLWQSPDMGARAMLGRLILACGQPLDEAPWLDEVVVNGRVRALTRKEEGQVAEVLAVGKASAATLSPLSPAEGGAAPITQSPPLPLETPVLATIVTRPATATGTVPATPPLHSRLRAAGKSLLRGFAAAANGFDGLLRRLVGEENNILRYFLWAALPLLLLAAGWLAASTFRQTPSAPAATKKSPGAPFVVTVTRPIPAPAPAPVTSPGKEIVIDLGGGVKLEMALIPAGEFLMGSPNSDNNAGGDEKPQHRVRITRPFYLGKHLVTQEQWQAVMGSNPSYFNGPKNAVETVS